MANRVDTTTRSGTYKVTLDTTGDVQLPGSEEDTISTWVLHVVNGGANPGSFIPKLKVAGSGLASTEYISPEYYKASTGSTAITTGTAVTTEDIYKIVADGCDVHLIYTADTHGMIVWARRLAG